MTKPDPSTTTIGWVGAGVMGRWMCQHVMDLGYQVIVYSRTPAKAKPLLDGGAREARLTIMIGGEPEPVQTITPLFEAMGRSIVHLNSLLRQKNSENLLTF